jgi:hypothetical protein
MLASNDTSCKGMFAIVSASYSGSTLLNALLASHPLIAGGGELHWLTSPNGQACMFCGERCPVWTQEVTRRIARDNLYHIVAGAFGRPFVCDSSKMVDWFKTMLPLHTDIPQAKLLLVKHPVRHVSSHMQKARHFHLPQYAEFHNYRSVLWHLQDSYVTIRRHLKIDLIVKYEDLVADPRVTMSRILALHGLPYAPEIESWQALPHHHIGGNSGPASQIAREIRPDGQFLQRKYDRDGVFLDDSFRDILTEDEFLGLQEEPDFRDICSWYGYRRLPLAAFKSRPSPRLRVRQLSRRVLGEFGIR